MTTRRTSRSGKRVSRSLRIENLSDLIKVIEEDKTTRRFNSNIDLLIKPLNLEKISLELEKLHSERDLRTLRQIQIMRKQQESVIKATLQNQAFRSRAIELKMQIMRSKNNLDELVDNFYRYLLTKWGSKVKDLGLKTIGERDSFLKQFYSDAERWQRNVNSTLEIIDVLVDDLDQAGWAIMRIVKALELANKERFDG